MIRLCFALLPAAISGFAPAQQSPEGYQAASSSLPAGAGNVLETAQGTLYFDGFQLQLDPGGGGVALLTFPSFTFCTTNFRPPDRQIFTWW